MKHKNLLATLSHILVAVIATFCATSGYATISAYEPFNYSPGALGTSASTATGTAGDNTPGGFTNNWAGSGTIVSGLTYSGLTVADNALSENGQHEVVSLASSSAASTVYVGFLYKQGGNNGGNVGALELVNNSGVGIAVGQVQAFSGAQGGFSVITASSPTTFGGSVGAGPNTSDTYGTTYLIVVELTSNGTGYTGGSVWIDPPTGTGSPGTPTFTFTGVTAFTLAEIGMINQGGGNASVFDEIRVGTTYADAIGFLAAPPAPTGVTATGGTSQVTLNWAAVSGATNYNVLRSTSSGSETSLGTSATTNYTDSTAVNGNQYFYVVQAVNSGGTSVNSAEVNATPMAAPTGLGATPGNNSVALTWTAPSGGGQTGYNVKRSTVSNGPYANISAPGAVTGTSYTDNTAAGGTTYYYVVSATNTVGESSISSQVSALPVSQPPTAPSGLVTVPTNSQVSLSWTAGIGDASYNVKRSTTSGSGYTTISATGTVTGTSYTDFTAVNGNIYYYVVTGTNSSGESAPTSQSTAAMPPAAPTGLGATAGANRVTLSWTAPTGASGATSYNVLRGTTSGGETALTNGITGTTFTDLTALSGTTYYYKVAGVNATGQGTASSEQSATPTGAPQAPAGVTITTNYTSLALNWTAALGAPTGYQVNRSTTSGAETALTNVSGTTFTDTSVVVGTEYFYTVTATNSYGASTNSAEVTGTAPGAPYAYESFNYSSIAAGTPTTAAGFAGTWTVNGNPSIVSGLTYPNLTTANGALQSSTPGDNFYENLSVPLNSGTVWVSFLLYQNGDNGGNRSGLELLNSSGTGVMFAYQQNSGTQGAPCLMNVSGTTTVGTQLNPDSGTLRTYAANNLYVLKLTYTAGTLTSISVYSDPTAGQNTAPTPDFTVTSGLSGIGAITTMGVLNPAGISMTVDEWNVGTSFGAVVPGSNIPAPQPPTGLTAMPENNSVNLSWNASSGATSYNVLQGTTSGGETVLATGVTSLNYTDTTAVNGTKYYYEVQAVNAAGTSTNSAEVSAIPALPPPPPAPTGLTATPGNNNVSLSWNPTAGATSYNVLQGTNSGGETLIASGVTTTNYTDSSAVNGTTYYYVVQTVGSTGTSTNSAEVSATPFSLQPEPPTGLTATPGNNLVTLKWNASAGATSYNVLQGTFSGGESIIASGVTTTNYVDNSTVNGIEYFYEVQGVNGFGAGDNSAEVNATPGTTAPVPVIMPVYRDSTGTNLVVSVATQSGFNYYLLTTTNLTPPVAWSTNTVTAGTGGTITNLVPINPAQPDVFIEYFAQ